MLAETIGVISALIILAISVCFPVKVCNVYHDKHCNNYCPGPDECLPPKTYPSVPAYPVPEEYHPPILKQHNDTQTARPSVDTGTDPIGRSENIQFPSQTSLGSRKSVSILPPPRRSQTNFAPRSSRADLGRRQSRSDARYLGTRPSRGSFAPRPSRGNLGPRPSRGGYVGPRPSRGDVRSRPSRGDLGARPSRGNLGPRPSGYRPSRAPIPYTPGSRGTLGPRPSRAGARPSYRPSRGDIRRPSRYEDYPRGSMR